MEFILSIGHKKPSRYYFKEYDVKRNLGKVAKKKIELSSTERNEIRMRIRHERHRIEIFSILLLYQGKIMWPNEEKIKPN